MGAAWIVLSLAVAPLGFSVLAPRSSLGASAAESAIYIADTQNHRIVRINNMQGDGWMSYGTFGSGVGQFDHPSGVAVDSQGRIYVVDTNNSRIVRISDMQGTGWISFGRQGGPASSENGVFYYPVGIAIDSRDRIYVADNGNFRIVCLENLSSPCGTGYIGQNVYGVALDSLGRRLATLTIASKIFRLPDDATFDSPVRPWAIAVGADDRIYFAPWNGTRIYRMTDMSGTGLTSFPFSGGAIQGIFIGPEGTVYVLSDCGISRMNSVAGDGLVSFGACGSGRNQFSASNGIGIFVRFESAREAVAIDAGHGRKCPDGDWERPPSPTFGEIEDKLTLDIAKQISSDLTGKGYEVVETRPGECRVNLEERARRANRAKAAVFVSIHLNALRGVPTADGTEVWIDPEKATKARSTTLASGIVQAQGALGLRIRTERNRPPGIKWSGYDSPWDNPKKKIRVLVVANMPAGLSEIAFLTNPREEALLHDPAFRRRAALAISGAIVEFLRR